MAAPICSTSRAEPSRSTRAINEACSVVGIASGCSRPVEHVAVVVLVQLLAFQHGLGQLLDEQRHAVGALDDLVEHAGRQRLAAGDVIHQRQPLAAARAG